MDEPIEMSSGVALLEHDRLRPVHSRPYLPCVGPEGTEHEIIVDRVGAQRVTWVSMPARDDQLGLLLDRHARRWSFQCRFARSSHMAPSSPRREC